MDNKKMDNKKYEKIDDSFLSNVAVDYASLYGIVRDVYEEFEEEFEVIPSRKFF